MRSFCYLLLLAAVSLPAHVWADEDESTAVIAEPTTLPPPTTPKPLCKEKMCARIYMPVCSLVDGEQVTAPSLCVLNNKIRCSAVLRNSSLESKVPTILLLHRGACLPRRDRSNVIRMKRFVGDEADSASSESSEEGDSAYDDGDDDHIDDEGDEDEEDEEFGGDGSDDDNDSGEDGDDEDDEYEEADYDKSEKPVVEPA